MEDQCLLPLVKRLLGLGHLIKSIDAYFRKIEFSDSLALQLTGVAIPVIPSASSSHTARGLSSAIRSSWGSQMLQGKAEQDMLVFRV